MILSPHQQKPDIDNYIKALLDAFFQYQGGDHTVYEVQAKKLWDIEGKIEVENLE